MIGGAPVEILDLSMKIDLILCLYEGKEQDFVNAIKSTPLPKYDTSKMCLRSVKTWRKPTKLPGTMKEGYLVAICNLLDIEPKVFKESRYHEFFGLLAHKVSSPFDIFKSFADPKNDKVKILSSLCGTYFAYYPMLDGSNYISKARIFIYKNEGKFKVEAYFKPGSIKKPYNGYAAYCYNKLYLIFESTQTEMSSPKGITMVISNTPMDHDKIHPFHGVVISTSSTSRPQDPTAAMIYIVPHKACSEGSCKTQKCKENGSVETCEEINREVADGGDHGLPLNKYPIDDPRLREELAYGVINGLEFLENKLPFVLQAKAHDIEKLRPK